VSQESQHAAAADAIRVATGDDLPALLDLLNQLHDVPETLGDQHRAAFAAVTADPRQRLFVVEREGRLLASAALVVVPNVTHGGRPYAIVESVVVDEAARGSGVGTRLMRHIIARARDDGCYKIALTSRKHRVDAHRFYARLGFEATSEGFRHTLVGD